MKISMDTKICDLKLTLKGSYVETCFQTLKSELKEKKIRLTPHIWISTDWFCPDGITGFALPFFLFSKELMELEKRMIGEAEGEGHDWCMMLMRHEMGHVLDNAYGLRKKKKRQQLFGLSSVPYPEKYKPNIYSKNFVRNLDDYYAQAHPDEDWAETFAVWLNPRIQWRKAYADWPALEKLTYVDSLMDEIANIKPQKKSHEKIECFKDDTRTLREYYSEKIKRLKIGHRQNQSQTTTPVVMM
jgi:hypothetical protein